MDCKGKYYLAVHHTYFQLFIYFFSKTINLKVRDNKLSTDCYYQVLTNRLFATTNEKS